MTVATHPSMPVSAFLDAHPGIDRFELLLPDLSGIARGKRLRRAGLRSAAAQGLPLPSSIFASRASGESVGKSGLVWEVGDKDLRCHLIPESLVRMPWAPRPSAQALLRMLDEDGTPFFADPRTVLEAVLARYAARDWTPVVALELEFFLIAKPGGKHRAPKPADAPLTGQPQTKTQVFGFEELAEFDVVLGAIEDACRTQGVPAGAASAEYAPSQFEINLNHVDDAVLAADHAFLLKRIIKGVATAHGMAATFMAKPFAEESGSGMHMHFSILDGQGRNIMAETEGEDPLSNPLLRHAVGGLAAGLRDHAAILAPTANAYRRFGTGSYAPVTTSWGFNNRTVAFRIPDGDARARRIEHRVPGADTNPHLVAASVLAAALDGIERRLDPPPASEGNAYETPGRDIPETWGEALRAFETSSLIEAAFGARFQALFHAVKDEERRVFDAEITPREWEWYLTTI
jgi:glutamine synthetase